MTEKQRLEEMHAQLVSSEANSYERMKKENVLRMLILGTKETGELVKKHILPIYENDVSFLKEIMEKLGYSPKYEQEYNHYYKTTCIVAYL